MSNATRISRRREYAKNRKGNNKAPGPRSRRKSGEQFEGPDGWWYQIEMRSVFGQLVAVKVYRPETMVEQEARLRRIKLPSTAKKPPPRIEE